MDDARSTAPAYAQRAAQLDHVAVTEAQLVRDLAHQLSSQAEPHHVVAQLLCFRGSLASWRINQGIGPLEADRLRQGMVWRHHVRQNLRGIPPRQHFLCAPHRCESLRD